MSVDRGAIAGLASAVQPRKPDARGRFRGSGAKSVAVPRYGCTVDQVNQGSSVEVCRDCIPDFGNGGGGGGGGNPCGRRFCCERDPNGWCTLCAPPNGQCP